MEAVASADDLEDGEMIRVEVDGEPVLIAKVDGEFYAVGDICTHAQCHLSDGWIEDEEVVCPCHHAKFDLESGEPTRPPATEPEPTFTVTEEDGKLYLEK